jgi:RNA polymerase sigma factor (sigma-70 family)
MQDREIVAAIMAGRADGLAAAYDRYARALHAYCCSVLGDQADAADAVQDTYIIAAARVGGLRDPNRLRPWLYAVARNECRRRLRDRGSSAGLDEAGEMPDDGPEVGLDAEQAELRALVWSALSGLNPGEREIIELNLRHELEGAGLAAALGVPRNQAHALALRARAQFETALGALLVARYGQQSCDELAAMLADWGGELTAALRKRINRHIERCDICGERKRRELSPAMLLSLLPVVMLPANVRRQLFRLVSDGSPAATARVSWVVERSAPYRPSGFPEPIDPPRVPSWWRSGYAVAAGVALLALLLLSGGAVFAADLLDHANAPDVALAKRSPVASPSAAAPGPGSAAPSTGPPPSPSVSASPTAAASTPALVVATTPAAGTAPAPRRSPPRPSPSPSASRSRSPSPAPSPSPSPSQGTLAAAPTTVRLVSTNRGPYTGSFTLTAEGGPIRRFSITAQDPAGDLSVAPASGSLAAGQSVTVTVTVLSATGLGYQTTLSVSPGGPSVVVEYPPAG